MARRLPAASQASQDSAQAHGLLALPDECLLAVLQCLDNDDDMSSLMNAARAHSMLHQAAGLVLSDITMEVAHQQQADSVALYLNNHSQHVGSICLDGVGPKKLTLRLPAELPGPGSLALYNWKVQLLPGDGGQLEQVTDEEDEEHQQDAEACYMRELILDGCELLGGIGAAGTPLQLPAGLEHLSLCDVYSSGQRVQFPTDVLQQLQQLTYLELADIQLQGPDDGSLPLQHLQALTGLAELRLRAGREGWLAALASADDSDDDNDGANAEADRYRLRVTGSMLASSHLSHLQLSGYVFEPAVLAGMTQLQHLDLAICKIAGGAAGEAQLLSHLQHLQQLTKLKLGSSLSKEWQLPPAAFSALIASSRLQGLKIGRCKLSAGAWQHLIPAGRQLSCLRSLDISRSPYDNLLDLEGVDPTAPEGSRLVSCCPGLQSLDMGGLLYSTELLVKLQGLSGLRKLHLDIKGPTAAEDLAALCQLTGLEKLEVDARDTDAGLMRQLTQLRRLTMLTFEAQDAGWEVSLTCEDSHDEPVWRQLLCHFHTHGDPEEMQQVASALAE